MRCFDEERVELDAAYLGAKFVCEDLVECDCSMPTDTTAFGGVFSGSHHSWKGRPVLCSEVDADEISYGVVRTCVTLVKATVKACAACSTGTKFYTASSLQSRGRHDVVEVGPLCTVHFDKCRNASKRRSKRLNLSEVNALVQVAGVEAASEVVLAVDVAQQAVPVIGVLQSDNPG